MTYYDHETAYRVIAARGGTAWDDAPESYAALDAWLASSTLTGDAIDLGCGGGQAAIRLARKGYRVTGVDFSPTAIELAHRNAIEVGIEATFVVGDCLALAFEDAQFDLAIDNHVLHCLIGTDRARFLREVTRVLRPGGLLVSETMSREGDFDPARAGCDPATFIALRGNRYWTSEAEHDVLLAACGFEVVERGRRAADPGFGDELFRVVRKKPNTPCPNR